MVRVLAFLPVVLCAQDVTAIVGATLVDGTGSPPRAAAVLLRGSKIEAVGADVAVPPGARVIEARGQTLLPGFFDVHTHLPYSAVTGLRGDWPKILKAYLYCGVTSVADFGTYFETFEPMRRLIAQGVIPGPRLHIAARFTTPLGHGAEGGRGDFFSAEVQTPREAHAAMKRILPAKPDVIKVFTDGWRYGAAPDMTHMDEETLRAIVEDAHKAGLKVLTHTVTVDRAKIAARAGADVIAHGLGDMPVDEELIGLMKRNRAWYAPTLTVYEPRDRGALPPLLSEVLEPAARKLVQATPEVRPRAPRTLIGGPPPFTRESRWKNMMANNRALHAAGIPFATGTDAGVAGTYHGWATLREMKLLVEGGLSPLEALTAATGRAARALGVDGARGIIAPGKLADLVLINGTPQENIADVEKIARVFLDGREIDRAQLAREFASDKPTPLPARKVAASVDEFERSDGRTLLGTLRVNSTDPGTDNSRMVFGRILRGPGDYALSIHARMAEKDRPYARVNLPLSPGAVEPADARAFQGIQFEARGEGAYRLIVATAAVRDTVDFSAPFEATSAWRTVSIPFSALKRENARLPAEWTGADLLMLSFEVSRPAGAFGWIELDNIRFQ